MKNIQTKGISILLAMCLLVLMPSGFCAALTRTAPERPSLVRLSWTQDPRTTMTVTWQDAADVERAWVEYTLGAMLDEEPAVSGTGVSHQEIREQEARLVEHASTLSDGGTQWTATLTGLEPGTTYRYRINSASADPGKPGGIRYSSSPEYAFTTQPDGSENPDGNTESADTVTFAYFGDVQVNQEAEGEFTRWGQLAQAALERHPDLQFGIMGGDIVESGISTEQFNMFFDAAGPVVSRIPLFATNGNHESNFLSGKPELYLDSFALPENGLEGFQEEFYSFDAGPAHILVLNSWVYSGEQKLTEADYEQIASWIRQDLTASDAPWKIAVMHHPLYAVHSDRVANLVQEHWAPILQEGGVRLLLCGHQHVYCRSVPTTDGLADESNGITQVMGVSGEKFYSSADELNMERTIYEISNYQILRVSGNSLEIQCFDRDGQELDYAVLSAAGHSNPPVETVHFTDVAGSDWFRDAVEYVVRKAYFRGVSENRFGPQQSMTRAMFVTVLGRLAGADPDTNRPPAFADIPAGQWYTAFVEWAAANGIVIGYDPEHFGPDDPVTREQMAAILYRYAQFAGQDVTVADGSRFREFRDAGQVSEYAEAPMIWATSQRLINGLGDGTLAPGKTASRAEVAQIIRNYSQKVA